MPKTVSTRNGTRPLASLEVIKDARSQTRHTSTFKEPRLPGQTELTAEQTQTLNSATEIIANPMKTHEEDIVELYDLYCAARPTQPTNAATRATKDHALFTEPSLELSRHLSWQGNGQANLKTGDSSNQMQLPAFLWFVRDAGLTLPSPEPLPTTKRTSQTNVLRLPPLVTYAAAARGFEKFASAHRRAESVLLSPFSADTSGTPYLGFRAAVRYLLLQQYARTADAVGATTLERLFWENCVVRL